jgi:DNA-binding HxlR family transcriptional regulator
MKKILELMPPGEPIFFSDLREKSEYRKGGKHRKMLWRIIKDLLSLGLIEDAYIPSVKPRKAYRKKII